MCRLKEKKLADVLADVFGDTELECRYENEVIFIVPRQTIGPQDVKGVTIKGKVSDKNGPMPGVTVIIKGTSIGVMTDAGGNYSLTLPDVAGTGIVVFICGNEDAGSEICGTEGFRCCNGGEYTADG